MCRCDPEETDHLFVSFCEDAEKHGFGMVYEHSYDEFFLYAWGRQCVA